VFTLQPDIPPSVCGFIALNPAMTWSVGRDRDGADLGGERRIFGWDFRPQTDVAGAAIEGGDVGTIYTFVANPDGTTPWAHSAPVTWGTELFTGVPDGHVYVDLDGHGNRVLVPNDDDPYFNGRIVLLNMISTLAAAAVAWVLIAQGGIIETVTQTPSKNRAARRRARHRKDPEVELVKIRRTHRELVDSIQTSVEGDDTAPDADQFRWVVSGHWRNQPFGPKNLLRRPVYIDPYLKGPDGAPVRRPRRVFVL
jgi:hypothetical protein